MSDSALNEKATAAVIWAAKSDMGMKTEEEDDEEKGNEKADTSDAETRRCVSANVGRVRVLDRSC